jgi:drug/metabolite transporter (DMT)-like permease
MNLYLLAAIVSPILYAFMNVVDKHIADKRAKNINVYPVLAGLAVIFYGLIMSFFLDWNGISLQDLIFPILVGVCSGLTLYVYFIATKGSDVSHFIGFIYLYPVIVALLAFIFLKEVIPFLGYLGLAVVLLGVFLLYRRHIRFGSKKIILIILLLVLLFGLQEFFIKISVSNAPVLNSFVISLFADGFVISLSFFRKDIRNGFRKELVNCKWALFAEAFTCLSWLSLYFAMLGLPATTVSAIAAIQPLAVLVFERFGGKFVGVRDFKLLPKMGAIILIVIGVILLSLSV